MKIICLYGSPRRQGNSAELARRFLAAAEVHGAEISEYHLNNLSLRGCQGCNRCKQDLETCVVKDDLTPVLDAVSAADLVVFASPVYYGDVSAQLKMFIDRSFCYLRPGYIALDHPSRLPAPKPLVFILTQGHPDPKAFADILPRYSQLFRWIGFAEVYPLRAVNVYHLGDVSSREQLLREADLLAERLVSSCRTLEA